MGHQNKRLSVRAGQTYRLPQETRQVRMLAGDAWVSLGTDDVIVQRHQTLHLHPRHAAVYVTPLGKHPIEMLIAMQANGESISTIH